MSPGAVISLRDVRKSHLAFESLEHPGLVAGFGFAFLHRFLGLLLAILVVAFFLLVYIGRLLLDGIVEGYVVKMLEIHAWPKLPRGVQLILLKMVNLALLRKATREHTDPRKNESAFERNSKRHPHW